VLESSDVEVSHYVGSQRSHCAGTQRCQSVTLCWDLAEFPIVLGVSRFLCFCQISRPLTGLAGFLVARSKPFVGLADFLVTGGVDLSLLYRGLEFFSWCQISGPLACPANFHPTRVVDLSQV